MPGIFVEIVGNATQFKRELDSAARSTSRFGAASKIAGGLLVTGLAIGLEKSVKAAIEAQASHARLEQAFKNVGLEADNYTKQIDAAEAAGRKLGFTDDSVSNSLGSLVAATGNVNKALGDLAVAQDLARFKHVDLEQATKMLTMAMTGSQRAVKQLGIVVVPVTSAVDALRRSNMDLTTEAGRAALAHAQLVDKMATGQQVIQKTSDLVHGQGQAFADSAAGGMAQFSAQINHLEIQVGTLLLPVLTDLLAKVNQMAAQFNSTLGPAIEQVKSAFQALHGATVLYNTLFLPIREMLLIWRAEFVAVNAVINASRATWSALSSAVVAAMHAVVTAVQTGMNAVVGAIRAAIGAVTAAANAVGNAIVGGIRAGLSAIGTAVSTAMSKLRAAIISAAGEAYRLAVNVGNAIVSGVIAGLSSLAGRVAGAVHGAISGAIHSVGGILHGSGEYQFTRYAVGHPLMDGMIAGIREKGPELEKAIIKTLTGASDRSVGLTRGLLLHPMKEAKQAVDDWAETDGVANFQGVGAKFASALGLGFRGGGVFPGAPPVQSVIESQITSGSSPTFVPLGSTSGRNADPGTVIVNVHGSVTTENQLVDAIQAGLLKKQARNNTLGFAPS